MTNKQPKLTILTANQNKVTEFERLLGVKLENTKLDLVEIQSTDVRDVVKHKAEEGYKKLGRPCFVDDTGLTIHCWGALPGALIKWFLDNVGNQGILDMLNSASSRSATATTAIGYCDQNGSQIFVGELDGEIADKPKGENGFGYDPIFIPKNNDKTFAEMTNAEKDTISMRAIVAKAMKEFLRIN